MKYIYQYYWCIMHPLLFDSYDTETPLFMCVAWLQFPPMTLRLRYSCTLPGYSSLLSHWDSVIHVRCLVTVPSYDTETPLFMCVAWLQFPPMTLRLRYSCALPGYSSLLSHWDSVIHVRCLVTVPSYDTETPLFMCVAWLQFPPMTLRLRYSCALPGYSSLLWHWDSVIHVRCLVTVPSYDTETPLFMCVAWLQFPPMTLRLRYSCALPGYSSLLWHWDSVIHVRCLVTVPSYHTETPLFMCVAWLQYKYGALPPPSLCSDVAFCLWPGAAMVTTVTRSATSVTVSTTALATTCVRWAAGSVPVCRTTPAWPVRSAPTATTTSPSASVSRPCHLVRQTHCASVELCYVLLSVVTTDSHHHGPHNSVSDRTQSLHPHKSLHSIVNERTKKTQITPKGQELKYT